MNQEELREKINHLLEDDRLEDAEELIAQLEPVSVDEFRSRVSEAPLDDEPVSPKQRAALDRAWQVLRATPIDRARSLG